MEKEKGLEEKQLQAMALWYVNTGKFPPNFESYSFNQRQVLAVLIPLEALYLRGDV
jgi:hypothetical protein